MLYIIASPIGNLADLTFRATQTIEQCDYLLCEDTRRTRILLNRYDLKKSLKSYHLFNEASRLGSILEDLKNGKRVGLISDAGTPLISDPGEKIVKACIDNSIEIRTLPGPSSVMSALILSGFATKRFQFVGFLPKKKGKKLSFLQECLIYPGTTICFESPFRLAKTLQTLVEIDPEKEVFVGREITKKFETHYRGAVEQLAIYFTSHPPKGELVLVF